MTRELDQGARDLERGAAVAVLTSEALASMVEMTIWSNGPDSYEARSVTGGVRFSRTRAAGGWEFRVEEVEGANPLAVQDPGRLSPLSEELSALYPDGARNSYPYAFEHIAQVFDHPCAPDLCVLHTAGHRPSSHRGEHGSLGVVQARAPFIMSGVGVRSRGMIDGHCRLVDVAPTILALLGVAPGVGVGANGEERTGCYLARQDGEALVDLLDEGVAGPSHVVGFLLDECNANVLYDLIEQGEAPNIAGLLERGTGLRHGALASLPSVTLANHTTVLTGCHPGHHGVLHNAWYDRVLERQVITESPATWQEAMRWLAPRIETIHEALQRARPGAVTMSVNEPADRGAGYSTFELFREGRMGELLPDFSRPLPYTNASFAELSEDYQWASVADTVSLGQALGLWSGTHLGVEWAPPAFMWVNFSLTDSAFHEGGPHSEIARAAVRDSDSRVGAVLAAVENAGAREETAVLVVADHGMEENREAGGGDWGDALRQAGITFRDEASGFLYFGD